MCACCAQGNRLGGAADAWDITATLSQVCESTLRGSEHDRSSIFIVET